jgi:hypothetical protein
MQKKEMEKGGNILAIDSVTVKNSIAKPIFFLEYCMVHIREV